MWMGIEVNQRFNNGWNWVQKTKTLASGNSLASGTTYSGISLQFIRLPIMKKHEMEGNREIADAEAVISARSVPITPSINDSYLQSGEEIYRVIGIDDYSNYLFAQVYGLMLRKVENLD